MWLDHEERPRKPWRVRWRSRGAMHTKRFASKPEAIAFMAKLQRDAQPLTNSKLTVAEWIEHWFDNHGVAWERSTKMQRASLLDLYIIPELGGTRLTELSRTDLHRFRSTLQRMGKSGHTINSAVHVMSAAIGAAVQDGVRESNPCIGLKPVPKRPVQRRPIPVAEIEAIRHELVEPRDRLVVSLLISAGHDVVQVAAWAGHSVDLCLKTYAHLFSERQGVPGESPEDVILRARHSITLTMPSQPSRSS